MCLLALDPTSDDGIHVQGTNRINYEGCWAHTNSTKATGINGVGTARAKGGGHCAVGAHVDAGQFDPVPTDGCSPVKDPFATVGAYDAATYTPTFVPPEKPATCTANRLNLKKGSFSLAPGRYCGGISLQAGASVTFAPGVYYIDDGVLNIQSGATAKGSDVVFYLAGPNAKFSLLGGGVIKLDGRKTGSTYEGFVIIMHPDANRFGESNIQGGGSFTINGMVYAPTQRMRFPATETSTLTRSTCSAWWPRTSSSEAMGCLTSASTAEATSPIS